jgi:hypothetical protein
VHKESCQLANDQQQLCHTGPPIIIINLLSLLHGLLLRSALTSLSHL